MATAVQVLRDDIFHGRLRPGEHLDEAGLGARLGVSRNTLREAFRVLAQERLVVHVPNRGVFVHELTPTEARHVYTARRILECGALREAAARPHLDEQAIRAVQAAADAGRAAADAGDWGAVGSANGSFHEALVGLAANPVLDAGIRHLMRQVRLWFVVAAPASEVHGRYVVEHEQMARLVATGHLVRVAVALEEYLLRAEAHLVVKHPLSGLLNKG